jgi:D-alanyl-D-alanine carboxypeptidase
MRSLSNIVIAAGFALILPAAALAAPSQAAQEKIEAVVTAAMKEYNIPGAAIAIDIGGTRWTKTFGYADFADKRPVAETDYFAIRSITKSFVVTALLQQIAAINSTVSLDDPVGKYLAGVPNGTVITLRQLANMTSGLYNYSADPAFIAAIGKNLRREWTVQELLDFAFHSKDHPAINFTPGARYEYSNTNTLLLGKVVAKLSERAFPATLAADILRPTHLDNTVYLRGDTLPQPRALGYQGFYDNQPESIVLNASSVSYSGAMAATIQDLAHWGNILGGGRLLPAKLQQQRFIGRPTSGDPNSPLYDRYGLGMGEIAGWWGHTGSGLGYEAATLHNVARDENFAILVNAANGVDVPARLFCQVLHILHPVQKFPAKSVCARVLAGEI